MDGVNCLFFSNILGFMQKVTNIRKEMQNEKQTVIKQTLTKLVTFLDSNEI